MVTEKKSMVLIGQICLLVGQQLGRTQVSPQDRFIEDLNAESFDILNIIAAVEDRFGVFLEEEKLPEIRTANDLYSRIREKLDGDESAD